VQSWNRIDDFAVRSAETRSCHRAARVFVRYCGAISCEWRPTIGESSFSDGRRSMRPRESQRSSRRAHQHESIRDGERLLLQVGAIGGASMIVLATNDPRAATRRQRAPGNGNTTSRYARR
jgi:hypothetical protein